MGTSHDTAAFAVSALRLWWQQEGSARYPGARRLLVVCDAGGSNGYRCRLWKDQLAVLAEETGLEITVCHFPPGTSKWNKIEHRLFCHITRTWRARPLMTKEDAVAGLAATTTYQGLKCTAVLDQGDYPGGVKVSDQRMKHLEARVIARHGTHGEWNYTLRPAPAGPGPSRRQRRGPARIWKDWPRWPGSATWAPCWPPSRCPGPPPASSGCTWTAAAAAARPAAACPSRLPFKAIVTAAACHQRLRMPYRLLGQLLGAHESTISLAARRVIPLLEEHGITHGAGIRIATLDELRKHAATAGITLIAATAAQPAADHAKRRSPRTRHARS